MNAKTVSRWTAGLVSAVLAGGLAGGCWLAADESDQPITERQVPSPSATPDPGRTMTPWEEWRARDCTTMAAWKRTHEGMPPPYVLVKRPGQLEGAKRVRFDAAYDMSKAGVVWQLAACPDKVPAPKRGEVHDLTRNSRETLRARPSVIAPYYAAKTRVIVQPHGVGRAWKLRASVEDWDRRLAALHMRVGRCADFPAAGCVHVYVTDRPRADYWGRWQYQGWWTGWIKLNRGYGAHRHVTCHELGHAWGLDHHAGPGCVNPHNLDRLASREELTALRRAY